MRRGLEILYLAALVLCWYSALVLLAAFENPAKHPAVAAFSTEHVLRTLGSALVLVGWLVVVLLQPTKAGVLKLARRLLAWPVLGSNTRLVASIVIGLSVAFLLQVPVLHSRRVWIRTCSASVRLCTVDAGDECAKQLVRLPSGSAEFVRVDKDTSLIALTDEGAVAWRGNAGDFAYASPNAPIDACLRITMEGSCSESQLTMLVTNESAKTFSFLGFELEPIYSAVYPLAAAHVGETPTLAPLAVTLGSLEAKAPVPAVVDVPGGEKGLLRIPLQVDNSTPDADYVHASKICVRYTLRGRPSCRLDDVLVLSTSRSRLHCKVFSVTEALRNIEERLDRFERPDSVDELPMLARIEPAKLEPMLFSVIDRSPPEAIGVRLDAFDALGHLTSDSSLSRLRVLVEDEHRPPSERLAVLRALARRDKATNMEAVLAKWVESGSTELASRAIEFVNFENRSNVCLPRLTRLDCNDAMLAMQCQAVAKPPLDELLRQWNQKCGSRSP
ncbi:MAG: hypothetical protein HOV81_22570 [Kofleriaceae bacterium]|nr:hypothetical protein [Kofleriaceae bacterium]